MGRTQRAKRVVVCGDSVALAGIATSLSLDPDCVVLSCADPVDAEGILHLHPDVVLFDLDAVSPALVYALARVLPGLLLIGIDLETNRALVWTEQQAAGLSSQELAQLIHRSGRLSPATERRNERPRKP